MIPVWHGNSRKDTCSTAQPQNSGRSLLGRLLANVLPHPAPKTQLWGENQGIRGLVKYTRKNVMIPLVLGGLILASTISCGVSYKIWVLETKQPPKLRREN